MACGPQPPGPHVRTHACAPARPCARRRLAGRRRLPARSRARSLFSCNAISIKKNPLLCTFRQRRFIGIHVAPLACPGAQVTKGDFAAQRGGGHITARAAAAVVVVSLSRIAGREPGDGGREGGGARSGTSQLLPSNRGTKRPRRPRRTGARRAGGEAEGSSAANRVTCGSPGTGGMSPALSVLPGSPPCPVQGGSCRQRGTCAESRAHAWHCVTHPVMSPEWRPPCPQRDRVPGMWQPWARRERRRLSFRGWFGERGNVWVENQHFSRFYFFFFPLKAKIFLGFS